MKEAKDTTTWRNLEVLASILRADSFAIVNLIEEPTQSTRDLAHLSGKVDLDALTRRLEATARSADLVVAGWGTKRPAGWRRNDWRQLLEAAVRGLSAGGHSRVAIVGGTPRHPSRWRQHTSPVHQRYEGATFEIRLAEALKWSVLVDKALTDPTTQKAVHR